jgi:uncharacterized membrane protein YecN with MAPEG domain
MSLKIVPFYASLLGLLFLYLTIRVVAARRAYRVALGHGGQEILERRVAAHLNFVEYTPLVLILLAFLEMNLAPALLLHVLGIAFVVSRVVHAIGVSRPNEDFRFRMVATLTTMIIMAVSSAFLLYATAGWFLAG